MDCAEVESQLARLLEKAPPRIVAAYLFGSVARRTARSSSDVDVALLLGETPPATLEGLELDYEGELEAAVGHPVQVVVLNRAPADLIHRVLRDGRLLLDRDRSARILFEVKARNEYLDLAPLRELFRRSRAAS